MNSEEEFKKSLKELLESKEFPFEESEWEKARKIIDDSKRKNRIVPFVLSGLLLFIAGLSAYFYYMAPAGTQPLAGTHQSSENTASGKVSPSISGNPSVLAPNNTATTGDIKSKQKVKTMNTVPVVPPQNTNASMDAGSTSGTEKKKTESPGFQAQAAQSYTTGAGLSLTIKKKKAIAGSSNTITVQQNEGEVNPVVTVPPAISPATETLTQPYREVPPQNAVQVDSILPVKSDKELAAVQPAGGEPAVQLTVTPVIPTESVTAVAGTEPTVVSLPDTATAVQAIQVFGTPVALFSVEAGATYLNGWNNHGMSDAKGFNAVIGFNYYYPLTNKIVLSAGLQYNSVGNLAQYSHTSKTTWYATGEESNVTVITPQKLHYAVVPFKLNVVLNPENTIGVGCNIAYLMDVTSRMETYNLRLNRTEDHKVTRTHGYTEGFKTFDTQFTVFYRRQIYKGLSLNGEVFMGVTDIKNNAFFKPDASEKNYGLKMTLVYKILNR